jgi:hypothetical protein
MNNLYIHPNLIGSTVTHWLGYGKWNVNEQEEKVIVVSMENNAIKVTTLNTKSGNVEKYDLSVVRLKMESVSV